MAKEYIISVRERQLQDQEIADGIKRFPRWHYEFDLQGHVTPIHDKTRVNRHLQRKSYFFDPLVEMFRGSLRGKRVLDLGCNAGFWSLAAVGAGCDFVLGIDGRRMHIDQANFVFEALAVERRRYRFVTANVFDIDLQRHGPFDVVLFLGLLYHIAKPFELMERVAAVNSDLLVVDTRISEQRGPVFEMIAEGTVDPRNAVEYGIALRPSRQAVLDLLSLFGYSAVVLKPRFSDYTGAPDYDVGIRKAILGSKQTKLSELGVPIES